MAPRRKKSGWGGARPGSGRKPLPPGARKCVPHRVRAEVEPRFPAYATARLRKGLPRLRNQKVHRILRECFAVASAREGFRLVHYSVQSERLHFLIEAEDREALSRGMQGLLIRVARALNRLWGRKGSVYTERYRENVLRTSHEVRNALVHVLNSHLGSHGPSPGSGTEGGIDAFSSGCWFDGWEGARFAPPEGVDLPVAAPRTWLLRTGWRRHGLIRPDEVPEGFV